MRVVPRVPHIRVLVVGTALLVAGTSVGSRSADAATVLAVSNSGAGFLETFRQDPDGAARGSLRWRYIFEATRPGSLVITPDGRRAYASASGGSVAVLDLDDGAVATSATVALTGTAGHTQTQPVYSPDGRFAFIGDWDQGGVIAFRIGEDGSFTRSGFAPKAGPSALAVSPDGKWLYAGQDLGQDTSTLSSFEIGADGSLSAARHESTGSSVRNLQVAPDGRTLYATSSYDELAVFSAGTDGSVEQRQLLQELQANDLVVDPDGRYVYASGSDGLLSYRVESDGRVTPIGPRRFGAGRGDETSITIAPDGRHLFTTEYAHPELSTFTIGPDGVPILTAPPVELGGSTAAIQRALAPVPDQAPTASFSVAPGAAGTATRFDASTSRDDDGTVARFDWDFGDGTTLPDGGPVPTHVYRTSGGRDVRLTVTDAAGTSTSRIFTGTQVLRNGGASATTVRRVDIAGGQSSDGSASGTPTSPDPTGSSTPPVLLAVRPGTSSTPTTATAAGGGAGAGDDARPASRRSQPVITAVRLSRTVLRFRAAGPLRVVATIARRSTVATSRPSGSRRVTHRRVAVARVQTSRSGTTSVRLSRRLRPGIHRVTATITDRDGRRTRVVLNVRVR